MNARLKIENLAGAEEYKEFTSNLIRVNRMASQHKISLDLPVLITVTGPGQGNTTYMRLLADLLIEEKILSFSGEEEVFEWRFLFSDKEAVQRLIYRMEKAAGFYPYFSGVIGLELQDLDRFDYLDKRLFELIHENQHRVLFCLQISEKQEKSCLQELQEALSVYSHVKTLHLVSKDKDLCQYVRDEFRKRGFFLGNGLNDSIPGFVEAARKNGYRSLNLAIDEVIWEKMSENSGNIIRPYDLHLYRDHQKARNAGKWTQKTIGFGAHEI